MGQIVGSYGNESGSHGFLYSGGTNGTYTTLDDPSATQGTFAQGINASGQIVGYYKNASGTHGFLYSGGTYTTLDDPLATNGTQAFGINDMGHHAEPAAARRHHGRHDPARLEQFPVAGLVRNL